MMQALLLSSLFPESDPSELATLGQELGFEGIDLAVHDRPHPETERTIALLAAAGAPVVMISVDAFVADAIREWAELAAGTGCRAVRTAPWPLDHAETPAQVEALAEVAASTGVTCLVPNHSGSRFRDLEALTVALAEVNPEQVAACLAPDHIPRSRAGDHVSWMARVQLPPLGAVALAGYRWTSEIGAGNIRVWTPRLTMIMHGLTPWAAWLQRLRESGFDGLFTFGEVGLSAVPGEALRILRDDLRFVRRVWHPGRHAPEEQTGPTDC